MSKQTSPILPENSVLFLGILNSLRSWSIYDTPKSVYSYSNVGGFGIDGCLSTCVGASLFDKNKIYFCVIGDLALFYDVNILGNRNIGPNVRILLSNNGTGYEMHCPNSTGINFSKTERDLFFCAGGHNGNKSRKLIRGIAEALGFEFISAETKEEYLSNLKHFTTPKQLEKPILFEVFVNVDDDDFAYNATKITLSSSSSSAKKIAKDVLGEKTYQKMKSIIKRKHV